jgi:cytochrome c biogenesis protein CcmG, thiol:disulfide interchange protein DsbE
MTESEEGESVTVGTSRVTGHTARWVAIGVGVVLIAFIGVLATRKSADSDSISNKLIGQPVPAVQGTTIDGDTYNIDEQRNRWVVVNFFATWCGPCVQEHPELVKFTQSHPATDVAVVSVSYGKQDPAVVKKFFDEHGGDWPVVADDDAQIALEFGTSMVPESYVVSPDGVVVAKFNGVTAAGLDQVIAQYTGGSAGASTTTTASATGS